MKTLHYRVAERIIRFCLPDDDHQDYLPSFEPFLYEPSASEQPLFTLTVDDSFYPTDKGDTIGQFDCGGADFGVYRRSNGDYQFLISPPGGSYCGLLQTDALFTTAVVALRGNDWARAFAVNNSMMLLFAFAAANQGVLLFHASVTEQEGRGYLFLGKSGTGKSTHSQQWLKYIPGSELMNDDNPVVVVSPSGATVFGSPWSGKTPCYRNVSAPIGAFVRIKQEPENHITRDDTLQAFASLLPSVSSMKWDDRVYDGICDSITALVEQVPCYTLGCRPDREAAEVCWKEVRKN